MEEGIDRLQLFSPGGGTNLAPGLRKVCNSNRDKLFCSEFGMKVS